MERNELTRFFQGLLVGFVLVGVLEGSPGIIVNSAVGLAATLLPDVLERRRKLRMNPFITAWILMAVSLHAFGALGPYTRVWWWDHMTHVLSASVVAGAGYAAVVTFERTEKVVMPSRVKWIFLVSFTMAFGVLWEVLEFGLGIVGESLGFRVLTQYGLEDTVMDLVFDSVGAVLVGLFGSEQVRKVLERD